MLAGLFYDELKSNRHRISKLKDYENKIKTSFLKYPVDKLTSEDIFCQTTLSSVKKTLSNLVM